MQGEPAAAEAGVTLQLREAHRVFSREVVPGSWDPGGGGLQSSQWGGWGGMWIATCARTQASWFLQQQS